MQFQSDVNSVPPLYRPKADQTISDFQDHDSFRRQQLCFIVAGTLWPYLEAGRAWRRPSLREKEDRQVVQCSCCSRSLAELNPLAPSLPSCNVPPIRDRRHPHFLQRRRRPRPPLSPSFLAAFLPSCLPSPSPLLRLEADPALLHHKGQIES